MRFTRFDATFDTDVCTARDNAELTIILRMGFRQINPANGAATGTYHDYGDPTATSRNIIPWTANEWEAWKKNFCSTAQAFWNGKFWLLNNGGLFAYPVLPDTYLPNVYCKFRLVGTDAAAGFHHHVIDVVRLAASETWFGSHSTLYDSLDTNAVQKATDSSGHPIMQQAHVHEVGHLLGLGHVDIGKAHCPATGDTNATACYGVADRDKNSVMGDGMQLRLSQASPWQQALAVFIKHAKPSTLYTPNARFVKPITAAMQRHYPRTIADFEGGKQLLKPAAGR